jgi:hypothetical protein
MRLMNPIQTVVLAWAVMAMMGSTAGAEVRLQVVRDEAATGANLIQDGGFETLANGQVQGWQPWQAGFRVAPGEGRNGSVGATCAWQKAGEQYGASQTITLNQQQRTPILVQAWSKAQGVDGTADREYALYCDLDYMDGTPLWGQVTPFAVGTHDGQQRQVLIIPAKPVRSLMVHCLFRGHKGQVWFDDVAAHELKPAAGTAILDGVPVVPPAAASGAAGTEQRGGGVALRYDPQRGAVTGVTAGGKALPTGLGPGGFLVRDVAANSDFHGFTDGKCEALGLELETKWTTAADALRLGGTLRDTTGKDRAVTLIFALPVDARGAQWGQGIHGDQAIKAGQYDDTVSMGTGATGTMARYPFTGVYGADWGLGLGADLDRPCQYRLVYNADTQQYFAAFDFGLVPETRAFPSAAPFGLVIYGFDPTWGFRAIAQKYYGLYPEAFACRSKDQGIWMPFSDISTVQGWEDFGFKYKEGNSETVWDDQHNILTFRYTEPSTWWMTMPKDMPRTYDAAMAEARRIAAQGTGEDQLKAKALLTSGLFDEQGQYMMLFRNEPWCDGAVFSMSCLPGIEGEVNDAKIGWNDRSKAQLYGPNRKGDQDGEYLDSLEGYVTADIDYRRDHFAVANRPLTFTQTDHRPIIHKGMAVDEYVEWMARDVHALGKLMFANSVPSRFTFLCRHLDVMGTETDWLSQGRWRPMDHDEMGMIRAMCAQKPYLFLMNTQFEPLGPYVERYFERCLLYGMYPSMFSPDASTGAYFTIPAFYNRDRALHKKYQPVIRRVAQAGWQPITLARTATPGILVERFGPNAAGETFLTVFNDGQAAQTAVVRLPAELAAKAATELLSGQAVALQAGAGGGTTFSVDLAPEACVAVLLTR